MKNFLSLLLIVLMSYAQEFDWSAQVRNRGNARMMNDNSNRFAELRTRLGLMVKADKDVSAFIQFQDSRVYGTEANTLASAANLDLHQGYILVDKLFDTDFSFKMGRMEMAYANQRIVGSVGWHNVGRAFDGSVLRYKLEKGFLDIFGMKTIERGLADDSLDQQFYGLHFKNKFTEELTGEAFYYSNHTLDADNNLQTAGFYVKGSFDKTIVFEGMFAKQFGARNTNVDYDGLYFFAKAGYKFSKDNMLSVGYESLSGDDGKDAKKSKAFIPIYGTNHKFNGFMDYFYVGAPSRVANVNGLNDLIISYNYKTFKIDFHMFMNNQDAMIPDPNNPGQFIAAEKSIGNEIDLTYKYKYSKNLVFVPGFSYFMFGDDHKNSSEKNDFYAYLMMIVNL